MSFGIPVRNGLSVGLLVSTFLSTRRALPPPALALNFLAGAPLDSRITFTRSTTATFVGSNGLLQSSAINAPRFDYNPTTLAPLGLLIEEQRVNLLLNSDILGTNLSTQSVTVTAQSYTISFYGTGTITLSGAASQVVTGTGAYPSRRTLTFTPTAGVLVCTVVGTVQYAQLEAGAFASSFIPTVASTVTRAGDNAVMTGTNFSSWYNQSEGTIVAQASTERTSGSAVRVLGIDDGTTDNRHSLSFDGTSPSTTFNAVTIVGAVSQAAFVLPVTPLAVSKLAYAYKANDFAASANGGAVSNDVSGTVPSSLTAMRIGSLVGGIQQLNGHLSSITYYATRLSNAQLQALST
jgi:hypothetical protein